MAPRRKPPSATPGAVVELPTGDGRPSLEGVVPRPGGPGHGQTDRGQMEAAEVMGNRALEMRMAGASYSAIAQALGYASKSSSHEAVQRALRADGERIAELRHEFRLLQLVRLERLIRPLWVTALQGRVVSNQHGVPRTREDGSPMRTGDPDLPSIDRIHRLLERQAKLLGLDAPQQVQITDSTRTELERVLDDIERMAAMAGEQVIDV